MSNLIKLKAIKNKAFQYNGNVIEVNDYEIDHQHMHLSVFKNGALVSMMIPNKEAEMFFNDLVPVAKQPTAAHLLPPTGPADNEQALVVSSQSQTLGEMRKQLMELNAKLSGDDGAKYIAQAKAINNNINTLINSMKLELSVAKELKKFQ